MIEKRRDRGDGGVYERKSDGLWVGSVDLGRRDGKRRRRVVYGKTKAEVLKDVRRLLQERDAGTLAEERVTVGACLARWLAAIAPPKGVQPSTHKRYSDLVRLHLTPGLGGIKVDRLRPSDVDKFLAEKINAGLAPRTAHHLRAALRAALSRAMRDGFVARNVAKLSDPVTVANRKFVTFGPDEARRFLEAVRGDRLEALYTTVLAVGLRQGEALGLRWEDIDLDGRRLTVSRALGRVRGKLEMIEVKTEKSRRTVVLPDFVVDALRDHKGRRPQDQLLAGGRWHENPLVFYSTIGTPIDAAELRRHFAGILRRAGLRSMRFHDLRHSAATLMMAQGVPARVVMETLGHSTITLTMNTYSHVLPTLQEDAAAAMDRVFSATRL